MNVLSSRRRRATLTSGTIAAVLGVILAASPAGAISTQTGGSYYKGGYCTWGTSMGGPITFAPTLNYGDGGDHWVMNSIAVSGIPSKSQIHGGTLLINIAVGWNTAHGFIRTYSQTQQYPQYGGDIGVLFKWSGASDGYYRIGKKDQSGDLVEVQVQLASSDYSQQCNTAIDHLEFAAGSGSQSW